MQGSRVLHPLYTCIARMDWKSNSSKNEKPMWHPGNFSNFCISHCTISRFAMLLRWTFMRRPPPPSVPSWGREKKRKEIPLYICPVTIGQLLHSSHRGYSFVLKCSPSLSLSTGCRILRCSSNCIVRASAPSHGWHACLLAKIRSVFF